MRNLVKPSLSRTSANEPGQKSLLWPVLFYFPRTGYKINSVTALTGFCSHLSLGTWAIISPPGSYFAWIKSQGEVGKHLAVCL